jgi:anti-sigma factor RsiW
LVGAPRRAERAMIEARVIERLRRLKLTRRHPRTVVLSRYLEDDLDVSERRWIEAHVGTCARCRGELASLTDVVQALGSMAEDVPAGLADSIIAAVHAESAPDTATATPSPDRTGQSPVTVLRSAGGQPLGARSRLPRGLRDALLYCVGRSQLRLTVPIAIVTGVVLSVVNMGGTLVHGRIDVGVCLMCAADFLVPFIALNLVLLMLMWAPAHRGPRPRGGRPA